MGKVCMSCYESYTNEITELERHMSDDRDTYICPKRNCRGEVVDIDDLFVSTIVELNMKGYFTVSSCSGHLEDLIATTSYIIFEDGVERPMTMPKGYSLTALTQSEDTSYGIVRVMDGDTSVKLFQTILANALITYVWARSLPDLLEADEFYIFDDVPSEKPRTSNLDCEKIKENFADKAGVISIGAFKKGKSEDKTE